VDHRPNFRHSGCSWNIDIFVSQEIQNPMIYPKIKQSLFDIAMEHAGSTDAAWDIAVANQLSMTDDLATEEPLTVPMVKNQRIVTFFQAINHSPATAISTDEINDLLGVGEGIEFWAIEYDFVVS